MQPPEQEPTEAEPVHRDYLEYEPPPPLQEATEAELVYRNYRDYEPPPVALTLEQRLIIGGMGILVLLILPFVWPESPDKFLNTVPTPARMPLFLISSASCLGFPFLLVWSVFSVIRGFVRYRYFPFAIWLLPILVVVGANLSFDAAYSRLLAWMVASAVLCLVESVIRGAPRPVVILSGLPLVCTVNYCLCIFALYAGQGC
jgi:hypothetical protein